LWPCRSRYSLFFLKCSDDDVSTFMIEIVFLIAGWLDEGEFELDDDDVGWFSLLCLLLCTGLSKVESLRLSASRKGDVVTMFEKLVDCRTFFGASASMLRRFRAGENGFLFSLSISDDRSTQSSSMASRLWLSCEGLMGQGRGLAGGLRDVKNEVSSDISNSNL
jgi:hypothetical protein